MRTRSGAAVAAAAALVHAGCEAPDREQAVAAVDVVLAGLRDGDGTAVCDRLSQRGVAELLLLGLEQRVAPPARGEDACAAVAEALPSEGLVELRAAPARGVLVAGRRATVETVAGAFELERREGRWEVSRLEPVRAALRRDAGAPVVLTVVRPEPSGVALGAQVALRSRRASLEVLGVVSPAGARVAARGDAVERLTAQGGRFRLRMRLRRGRNVVRLRGTAAGRRDGELAVRVVRR